MLYDTVNLENSVNRGRLLVAVVQAGSKLLEIGEHEERPAAIEAALGSRFASVQGSKRRGFR